MELKNGSTTALHSNLTPRDGDQRRIGEERKNMARRMRPEKAERAEKIARVEVEPAAPEPASPEVKLPIHVQPVMPAPTSRAEQNLLKWLDERDPQGSPVYGAFHV
jgi:hypothetical protein